MAVVGYSRQATHKDIEDICILISIWSSRGLVSPRTHQYVVENISSFYVVDNGLSILAACSINAVSDASYEIRSLMVLPNLIGLGVGRQMLRAAEDVAFSYGAKKVFVCTRDESFFRLCGYEKISCSSTPDAMQRDCRECHLHDQGWTSAVKVIQQ